MRKLAWGLLFIMLVVLFPPGIGQTQAAEVDPTYTNEVTGVRKALSQGVQNIVKRAYQMVNI